ncbi:amidohydrolase family protein [Mucilaginibacter aquaedulcis]|uniref:amidohydrolase family protein n=1 Tax=Mucilaginibacter aquaedulcis TaxID=1187081 RepID=UPI0025B3A88B|nr:amidohydrolase family protein [Mucilaginibacter aquaedulcis]MDN3547999.1 amidohydrolase family protein [Mucilaginibacter aquaedulcis]
MILHGLKQATGGASVSIDIFQNKINNVSPTNTIDDTDTLQLYFNDALVFPGLINSHDHLDFNLFPKLGKRIYTNYTQWGAYIHQQFKYEINNVLQVPSELRIKWGIYKNLLCGVTTVVNHGERLSLDDALITVYEDTHDLHSPAFEKAWKLKINNPLKRKLSVVIHTGEGTDEEAGDEIHRLISWNILHRNLIGIHGVAMNTQQANHFKAIVWCPQSNYFLLNKTAPIHQLKHNTSVIFGTDSTLTSDWNIWEHIALARKTSLLTDEELYNSLTIEPSKTWGLNTGQLTPGKDADIVITRRKDKKKDLDAFYEVSPADILLIMHQGKIRLFEQELLPQLAPDLRGMHFSLVKINGSFKYVEGNLEALISEIREYLPEFVFPIEIIGRQII